jgi:hypothetical protein
MDAALMVPPAMPWRVPHHLDTGRRADLPGQHQSRHLLPSMSGLRSVQPIEFNHSKAVSGKQLYRENFNQVAHFLRNDFRAMPSDLVKFEFDMQQVVFALHLYTVRDQILHREKIEQSARNVCHGFGY